MNECLKAKLTFEHGADLPDAQAAQASKLTKGKLKEKQGDATEHQHDEVREHEGPWKGSNRILTLKQIVLYIERMLQNHTEC